MITIAILTTSFALSPYFTLGVNLNGILMITIGGGYKNNNLQGGFQIAFEKEEKTFVIAPELYFKKMLSFVFGKINLGGYFQSVKQNIYCFPVLEEVSGTMV